MQAVAAQSQQVTLSLSPESRQVPLGDWDGQRPRRFELPDPDGAAAPAAEDAFVDGAPPAPPPPPLHPAVVAYDVRALIDARIVQNR